MVWEESVDGGELKGLKNLVVDLYRGLRTKGLFENSMTWEGEEGYPASFLTELLVSYMKDSDASREESRGGKGEGGNIGDDEVRIGRLVVGRCEYHEHE